MASFQALPLRLGSYIPAVDSSDMLAYRHISISLHHSSPDRRLSASLHYLLSLSPPILLSLHVCLALLLFLLTQCDTLSLLLDDLFFPQTRYCHPPGIGLNLLSCISERLARD